VISKLRTSTKIIRSIKEGLSPEIIRPFPKARPRKIGERKRGKTGILTDTPEKNESENQKCKKGKVKKSGKILVKKWLITVDSSEEDPEDVTYIELSDDDYTTLFESEMADVTEEKMEESMIFGHVAQGDFDLVKLARKKRTFFIT
jgi:hypothetical protein